MYVNPHFKRVNKIRPQMKRLLCYVSITVTFNLLNFILSFIDL